VTRCCPAAIAAACAMQPRVGERLQPERKMRVAIFVALLIPLLAPAAEKNRFLDANLTNSQGATTRLSRYWGKPVILFYEDVESVKVNQEAKMELKKLSDKYHLRDVVDLVAVANLEGLNWEPARMFALATVRSEELKNKVPVLVDMTGELRKAPWNLSARASTLLIISPSGELLFEASGKIDGERLNALVSTLRSLITESVRP
jgi:hypothetical protein